MRKTIAAAALAAGLGLTAAQAQTANPAVENHLVAAKAAAGLEWENMLGVCLPDADPSNPGGIARAAPTTPPRAEWYARPQKVFENNLAIGWGPRSTPHGCCRPARG